ncbi:MAG: hypothetical protein ACRDLN_10915, partial [Solirubrobacteraceae bacterium]
AEEFARQTERLVECIATLDADLLGLVELENNFKEGDPGNALEYLVEQLNAELGADVYDWVYPGTQFVGGDAISCGFIYKTGVLQIAEGTSIEFLDDSDLPGLGLGELMTDSTAGTVFGGVTPANWPVVVALNKARTRVDKVVIGLDMTCTSGDSFGTSDGFERLKLSSRGRFTTTFGPQRIDAGGVPADVESKVIGRLAKGRSSMRGIWSLKITIYDAAGATVMDTCESGIVRWTAKQ